MPNFCVSSPPATKTSPPTLSTALSGTPVIAAMLLGLAPRDLVLRAALLTQGFIFYFLSIEGRVGIVARECGLVITITMWKIWSSTDFCELNARWPFSHLP